MEAAGRVGDPHQEAHVRHRLLLAHGKSRRQAHLFADQEQARHYCPGLLQSCPLS